MQRGDCSQTAQLAQLTNRLAWGCSHQEYKMMIPMTQSDEVSFAEAAACDAELEVGDCMRLAQGCVVEEMLGAVFGSITLWYLVTSLVSLA
jgi:hypothetical protein